jgi:hypothetical protein
VDLYIEPQGEGVHSFLSTLPLWSHLYIEGREWIADGGGYQPDYSGTTSVGGTVVTLRPKAELLRRVQCGPEQEACSPEDDPICNEPNAEVSTRELDGRYYVDLVVYDEFGFVPTSIEYTLNGVAQTPVAYVGTGGYALGPFRPWDVIVVTLATSVAGCDFSFEAVVIPKPESHAFTIRITGDATFGSFANIISSTGFMTMRNLTGYGETFANGGDPAGMATLAGDYLLYASDAAGVVTGTITEIWILTIPFIPLDFTGLTALTLIQLDDCLDNSAAPLLVNSSLLDRIQYTGLSPNGGSLISPPVLSFHPILTSMDINSTFVTQAPQDINFGTINFFSITSCPIPVGEVNRALVELDANGINNGGAFMSVAPDGSSGGFDGSAAKTSLQGKGWTVTP